MNWAGVMSEIFEDRADYRARHVVAQALQRGRHFVEILLRAYADLVALAKLHVRPFEEHLAAFVRQFDLDYDHYLGARAAAGYRIGHRRAREHIGDGAGKHGI